MAKSPQSQSQLDLQMVVDDILSVAEQEREKEIIARRFGLMDRKETLEQIGEYLGITRERVRQLEKAILIRLRLAANGKQIKQLPAAEKTIIRNLTELGRIARMPQLAEKIIGATPTATDVSQVAFIAEVSEALTVIDENDNYYQAAGIAEYGDKKLTRQKIDEIVKTIKANKKPVTVAELDEKLNYEHPSHIEALASISKKLATLNNKWGLIKWPEVNPKNIKDKIYVVLSTTKQPMHFSEINDKIKNSNFKRKAVTSQAIHNELIKDSRFVLIGRGIYALEEWGYKKGTVAEIIADVIQKNGEPMFRDDIVREVLKRRRVKETTVLLNLQSRPEFKRTAKSTYSYQPVEI